MDQFSHPLSPLMDALPYPQHLKFPPHHSLRTHLQLQATTDPLVIKELLTFTAFTTQLLESTGFSHLTVSYPGYLPKDLIPHQLAGIINSRDTKPLPKGLSIRLLVPGAATSSASCVEGTAELVQGIAQIPVLFFPTHIQVGPVVTPASPVCLQCLDYALQDLSEVTDLPADYPLLTGPQLLAGAALLGKAVNDLLTLGALPAGKVWFVNSDLQTSCLQWQTHPRCDQHLPELTRCEPV